MRNKLTRAEQRLINSLAQLNSNLEQHIGRTVKYITPTCAIECETFVVRHIQKNYKGQLCFNLVCITGETAGTLGAQFGRCCDVQEVYFVFSQN